MITNKKLESQVDAKERTIKELEVNISKLNDELIEIDNETIEAFDKGNAEVVLQLNKRRVATSQNLKAHKETLESVKDKSPIKFEELKTEWNKRCKEINKVLEAEEEKLDKMYIAIRKTLEEYNQKYEQFADEHKQWIGLGVRAKLPEFKVMPHGRFVPYDPHSITTLKGMKKNSIKIYKNTLKEIQYLPEHLQRKLK